MLRKAHIPLKHVRYYNVEIRLVILVHKFHGLSKLRWPFPQFSDSIPALPFPWTLAHILPWVLKRRLLVKAEVLPPDPRNASTQTSTPPRPSTRLKSPSSPVGLVPCLRRRLVPRNIRIPTAARPPPIKRKRLTPKFVAGSMYPWWLRVA